MTRAGGVEFELLCSAVRPIPDRAHIHKVLRTGVDSDIVVDLAAQHGVRPNLVQSLSSLSWELVPERLREALEAFRHAHLLRVLSVSNELIGLAAAFSESGIDFATFKGPVLALQLYGDLALREYSDIDIIVPTVQMDRTEDILAVRGYRNIQGDRAFRRAFLRHQRQYAFAREGFDASIDLHWDFTAEPLPFPLRPSEIWTALEPIKVGSVSVPTIAGQELALLLAGHGTKEAWRSLGWVNDFAMLIERNPGLDWSNLHARARRNGSGLSILLAIAMAQELLGTPVPPALAAALAGNRQVASLAADLAARLRGRFPADAEQENLADLLVCDRFGDKIRAAAKMVMTPTPGDYQALPLPAALWPVYRMTRPVRLATRLISRALRRQPPDAPGRR
jgi:hypothetical protein